jgi:hypothetical protein
MQNFGKEWLAFNDSANGFHPSGMDASAPRESLQAVHCRV